MKITGLLYKHWVTHRLQHWLQDLQSHTFVEKCKHDHSSHGSLRGFTLFPLKWRITLSSSHLKCKRDGSFRELNEGRHINSSEESLALFHVKCLICLWNHMRHDSHIIHLHVIARLKFITSDSLTLHSQAQPTTALRWPAHRHDVRKWFFTNPL